MSRRFLLLLAGTGCVMLAASARAPLISAQAQALQPAALPPLNLAGMKLWDWKQPWHASQWPNATSTIPWRADRITVQSDKSVALFLDRSGAPQLQAVEGTPAMSAGLWEVDVTLPELRDGLVVAPLWLYNEQTRDEIDFELAGRKGLDVTMHVYSGGQHRKSTERLFAGQDLSHRRLRFAISLDTGAGRAAMLLDGKQVHLFDRSRIGFFISSAVRPRIEMWAADPVKADLVNWVGRWPGLAEGERLKMTVHGFRTVP